MGIYPGPVVTRVWCNPVPHRLMVTASIANSGLSAYSALSHQRGHSNFHRWIGFVGGQHRRSWRFACSSLPKSSPTANSSVHCDGKLFLFGLAVTSSAWWLGSLARCSFIEILFYTTSCSSQVNGIRSTPAHAPPWQTRRSHTVPVPFPSYVRALPTPTKSMIDDLTFWNDSSQWVAYLFYCWGFSSCQQEFLGWT